MAIGRAASSSNGPVGRGAVAVAVGSGTLDGDGIGLAHAATTSEKAASAVR
jgi:hypothetical protein